MLCYRCDRALPITGPRRAGGPRRSGGLRGASGPGCGPRRSAPRVGCADSLRDRPFRGRMRLHRRDRARGAGRVARLLSGRVAGRRWRGAPAGGAARDPGGRRCHRDHGDPRSGGRPGGASRHADRGWAAGLRVHRALRPRARRVPALHLRRGGHARDDLRVGGRRAHGLQGTGPRDRRRGGLRGAVGLRGGCPALLHASGTRRRGVLAANLLLRTTSTQSSVRPLAALGGKGARPTRPGPRASMRHSLLRPGRHRDRAPEAVRRRRHLGRDLRRRGPPPESARRGRLRPEVDARREWAVDPGGYPVPGQGHGVRPLEHGGPGQAAALRARARPRGSRGGARRGHGRRDDAERIVLGNPTWTAHELDVRARDSMLCEMVSACTRPTF